MSFHDITNLPKGSCDPRSVSPETLSINDHLQVIELLHGVYLCEESHDNDALKKY
ncbi:hypothetical protein [Mastigocoleus testarum]|uniref:hypothetical protein n=1 Tax=Mastigocoleus testarum TaxID=996925 RepID=UPI0004057852|nr:hypothetical protein [Mastigocoleus testarum]